MYETRVEFMCDGGRGRTAMFVCLGGSNIIYTVGLSPSFMHKTVSEGEVRSQMDPLIIHIFYKVNL